MIASLVPEFTGMAGCRLIVIVTSASFKRDLDNEICNKTREMPKQIITYRRTYSRAIEAKALIKRRWKVDATLSVKGGIGVAKYCDGHIRTCTSDIWYVDKI